MAAIVVDWLLLFVISIGANSTIILPLPIEAGIFALSAMLDSPTIVLMIGIVSGTGAAIGELTAYFIGFFGARAVERARKKSIPAILAMEKKLRESPAMPVIFLGSLTPFPFDIIGIACGLLRYNVKKFFVAALAGKLVRYVLVAFAGFYGMQAIKAWFFLG